MTYRKIVAITPDDAADLPENPCHAIWCTGSAGNVNLVDGAGNTVVLPIESGFDKRITIKSMRVLATNTTATTLYACYL